MSCPLVVPYAFEVGRHPANASALAWGNLFMGWRISTGEHVERGVHVRGGRSGSETDARVRARTAARVHSMQVRQRARASNGIGGSARGTHTDSPVSRREGKLQSTPRDPDGIAGWSAGSGFRRNPRGEEDYIGSIHAAVSRDYEPMTKIF